MSETVEGRMPAERRRALIVEIVETRPFVRVSDLARRYGVSEVTIRADLETLSDAGRLRRVRGGAVSVPQPRREASYVESLGANANEKEAVGRAAAALVQSGESVFLDAGTTTTALARALAAREELEDIVVVTNALPIALELETAIPRFAVIVTGGTLRPMQHSLVDPLASILLDQLHIDTAFIGCTGITAAEGFTNINVPEAEVKRQVLRTARRSIVIADGSKVGTVSLAPVCPIDAVDLLITGASAPPDGLDCFEAEGLAVDVVVDDD